MILESKQYASSAVEPIKAAGQVVCDHCGTPCGGVVFERHDKVFCCQGCLTVFELLSESGLGAFYDLGPRAGIRVSRAPDEDRFRFLDDPAVLASLLDFTNGRTSRVTFTVPAIHCVACVWLLENLFRLRAGIGQSRVNFPRKEVSIAFDPGQIRLSELALLLTSIGYAPQLNLANVESPRPAPVDRRLWLQVGVAGFAFGNSMLFSISNYLGLGIQGEGTLQRLFGYLSLALAAPVLVYSASDYWRSAWIALRQRVLTIDLPIAVGLAALFAQSAFEILSRNGEGYIDSLTGLVLFLLCGKVFQQKTFAWLAFDRDYRSFFPLAVTRRTGDKEEVVPLSRIQVGDRVLLRRGELIPADARLVSGDAMVDYSFVTGESEVVRKEAGEHLYAGGQQMGGLIELETVKPVSQSYLTSLWGHEVFAKPRTGSLQSLTNRYSKRFTITVAAVALGAAVYWSIIEPARAVKAFTSVLIVACPCALALAAPFALGTAQRLLARKGIFLKNAQVIEAIAKSDVVVFDKTGTLTVPQQCRGRPHGGALGEEEENRLRALVRHSTHPYSVALARALGEGQSLPEVANFVERPGKGIEGIVDGRELRVGSAAWFQSLGVVLPEDFRPKDGYPSRGGLDADCFSERSGQELDLNQGRNSGVHLAIDGVYRGHYEFGSVVRPDIEPSIRRLACFYDTALLSGDRQKDATLFRALFGARADLRFNQSPMDKLNYIRQQQASGKRVLMVGDGLNDAGALRQSDVGVAVVEDMSRFSPASDIILEAQQVQRLPELLNFSRLTVWVVWASLLISSLYNIVGISIAARGALSPLICAVLMPLSSATVVAFACGATTWMARRTLRGGGRGQLGAGEARASV